jgi:hypothetical protein
MAASLSVKDCRVEPVINLKTRKGARWINLRTANALDLKARQCCSLAR